MSNMTSTPTSSKPVDRTVRKILIAELPVSLRSLNVTILAHTLSQGVPVSPSALAVVLAAHADMCECPLRFTAAHVQELLWFGLAEFCEDYGIEIPAGCPEALHALLSLTAATDSLDTAGEPIGRVFEALRHLTTAC